MANEDIRQAIQTIFAAMRAAGYSERTIIYYRQNYDQLLHYLDDNNITAFTDQIGLCYLSERYGLPIEDFFQKQTPRITNNLRSLKVLWDYIHLGSVCFDKKSSVELFQCPESMQEGYAAFTRAYPNSSHRNNKYVRRFITYLEDSGVTSFSRITPELIKSFLTLYVGCVPKTIATVAGNIKRFFRFLHAKGFLETDYSGCFMKARVARNANIPASWRSEDIKKLLSVVDRNDSRGKRDYTILLLLTQLGLRISDIRNLKFENIDWVHKKLHFVMVKTGHLQELPLPDEVGWAIIDYIKNGRPKASSPYIFIRARAPYIPFSSNNNFMQELRRYMKLADINIVENQHMGTHSLRSSVAKNLLEKGEPVPVISAVLGHDNICSTSHYLKIDLEGLRKCTIDPEEVLCCE